MKNIANKLYSYLQRKKLILRDNCPFDEAYDKIKKLKKFENWVNLMSKKDINY